MNYVRAESLFQIIKQVEKSALLPAWMDVCTHCTQQNGGRAGPKCSTKATRNTPLPPQGTWGDQRKQIQYVLRSKDLPTWEAVQSEFTSKEGRVDLWSLHRRLILGSYIINKLIFSKLKSIQNKSIKNKSVCAERKRAQISSISLLGNKIKISHSSNINLKVAVPIPDCSSNQQGDVNNTSKTKIVTWQATKDITVSPKGSRPLSNHKAQDSHNNQNNSI